LAAGDSAGLAGAEVAAGFGVLAGAADGAQPAATMLVMSSIVAATIP
jgi:hypothetical protein